MNKSSMFMDYVTQRNEFIACGCLYLYFSSLSLAFLSLLLSHSFFCTLQLNIFFATNKAHINTFLRNESNWISACVYVCVHCRKRGWEMTFESHLLCKHVDMNRMGLKLSWLANIKLFFFAYECLTIYDERADAV
jgi:hypothetical protein